MSDTELSATDLSSRRWMSLLGICLITALVWFTASDISLALPSIGKEFSDAPMDTLQWAVNGYFLAGALIIVGGRIGDVYGRRLIFGIGAVLVIIGSIVAGISQGAALLILGRVIEGVGAAAILPNALAMVVVLFRGRERETAIATWIAVCWGAQALGPLLGGVLIALGSWRWIFWINLPIAAAALVLTWWATPETKQLEGSRSIDIPGAVTMVAGIGLLLYGLTAADNVSTGVLAGIFAASLALLVIFVVIELRTKTPVVVMSIFRNPRFDGAVLANLIANFVFGAVVFFMAQYLQVVSGFSPLQAGLYLLPATIPILLLNPIGTAWSRKKGPALPTIVGMIGLVVSAFLLSRLQGSEYGPLLVPFILLGVGIGLQITPCAVAAVEDPGEAGEGVASGIYKASSMIGGALGVAVSTAVFQNRARIDLTQLVAQVQPPIYPTDDQLETFLGILTGGPGIEQLQAIYPEVQKAVVIVFDAAIGSAMIPLVAVSVAGALLAAWLLRGGPTVPEESEITR